VRKTTDQTAFPRAETPTSKKAFVIEPLRLNQSVRSTAIELGQIEVADCAPYLYQTFA